jgi:hypothetical protein
MDFDRCSGLFSNPDTIFNQGCNPPYSCDGISSIEFSPNGRFVYTTDVYSLNQYDLWASNIQDSVSIYNNSNSQPGLDMLQIAPNGKIYISTWNGIGGFDFIHVIKNPDSKGDSSYFVYGGQHMPGVDNLGLPNMINYRLGPLMGSGCDTIASLTERLVRENPLRIIPNPADKYVYVEISMQGSYEFDLLSAEGQLMDKKETKQVDIFDTENLSDGVYFLRVIDKGFNNAEATRKLVIRH